MTERLRYRKKSNQFVVAVQVNLDIDGFDYRKWGALQRCKAGDWLLDNDGDIYTVDREVFARTYRQTAPGQYVKSTPVWAEQASEDGRIDTREGSSSYEKGDYIVYNDENGSDAYCVSAVKFESMYEAY